MVSVDKERILIVDDEPLVLDLVASYASHIGFEATTARNGKEALERLKSELITILITDIKMPEMDGFELMKAVRSEFPDIHIMVMTAHGASYTFTDVVECGATDYIPKPFTLDEMRAKLNRIVREKGLLRDLKQKSLELEKVNEDLKRLDNLKSIFVSSVSHELRTPLTVIKEFISLMLEGHGGTLTEDQREYLGIAHKNILRLTNLIDTLLDFSRIESGKGLQLKFEPARLVEVVEDASMTLSQSLEEKRIALENRLDPEMPQVLIDRNRLVEVLINLINNGIKFTPTGGKITIDTKGLTEKRDYLKMVVSDTGIGIPPEDLPKVFDRFYQGHSTGVSMGSGLGLAITKEIIEGHRGTIQAESRLGSGTTFIFTLPLLGVNNIFQLLVEPMLEESEKDEIPFSMLRIKFWDPKMKREVVLSHDSWGSVKYALQKMVRSVDIIVPFPSSLIYLFSFIDHKLAREIGERVEVKLTQGGYVPKGTEVQFTTYSFPQDCESKEEFLKGCHQLIKME
ncbi:MAG: hybrid sensor histidine kinase/response regulator [Deltaproteobacteria bacterium]|nr:hybrid sensor histidine kinase/response regulator [Deltaproteobacteria bacterium]